MDPATEHTCQIGSDLRHSGFPTITVQAFEDLVPNSALSGSALSTAISGAMSRFDLVQVASRGEYVLRGAIGSTGKTYSIKATLSAAQGAGILWTTSLSVPSAMPVGEIVESVSTRLAGMLEGPGSPLFDEGKAWLKFQTSLPEPPTPYVCALVQMNWYSSLKADDATRTRQCVERLLAARPDDAVALATRAGMLTWEGVNRRAEAVGDFAQAGEDLAKAISLSPQSAFVHEMNAFYLRATGKIDAALDANAIAIKLNPSFINALALRGEVLWIAGKFEEGARLTEQAIAGTVTPPYWYYSIRAYEALRTGDYVAATQAALDFNSGDAPLAGVVTLAAAALAGRQDLVDKFSSVVMSTPSLQTSGILPMVQGFVPEAALTDRVREGLLKAGIPQAALDGPFTADGKAAS